MVHFFFYIILLCIAVGYVATILGSIDTDKYTQPVRKLISRSLDKNGNYQGCDILEYL